MNVSEIIHGKITTLELQREDEGSLPASLRHGDEVQLVLASDGSALLSMGDEVMSVVGTSTPHQQSLDRLTTRGMPKLAWVVQRSTRTNEPEQVMLQVHEFSSSLQWEEPMDVGIDDRFLEDLRQRLKRRISESDALAWLTTRFVLPPVDLERSPRALLSGPPLNQNAGLTAFRLYGKRYAVDVKRGEDDRLLATRLVQAKRAQEGGEKRPIYLLTTKLSFCSATAAGLFRGTARTELDHIVQNASSYLALWEEYNKIEQRNILERARAFGWLKYTRSTQTADGAWRFDLVVDPAKLDDVARRLEELEHAQLQAASEIPSILQGTSEDFSVSNERRPFVGEMSRRHLAPPHLIISPTLEDRLPPERGYLFIALGGDNIRITRRTDAWEKIRSGDSPLPQLGLLIEGVHVPTARHRKKKALTSAVLDVLPHPTTDSETPSTSPSTLQTSRSSRDRQGVARPVCWPRCRLASLNMTKRVVQMAYPGTPC